MKLPTPVENEKALQEQAKKEKKKFVTLRRGCPWIKAAIWGKKPVLICRGTNDRCLPDGCPIWYWRTLT